MLYGDCLLFRLARLTMNTRISIVIPAYNEAAQLAACLRTIAVQRHKPFEVIVVDNNSTDRTAAVARRFKFVTVITAKRQGVVHARDRGFNAARGDIIGRIDADTRLPRDWTQQLIRIFADTTIDAVTGSMEYYDIPCRQLFSMCDLLLRRRTARLMGDEVFLQGANMAIRRSAWQVVKHDLCRRAGLHEDFDVAIHLSQAGRRVAFDESLRASISARCVDDGIRAFWSYALLNPSTYAQHELTVGRHMYLTVGIVLLCHLPMRTLYRSHNAGTELDYVRVNPATFVD